MDNDVGQSVIELGSTSSCRAYTAVYVCYNVDQFFSLQYSSTFYVLCSSQVCSDCANVAMNGKVKAIWHKVQCLLCRELSGCVNFTSMSEIPTR